jgi:hypothetical protein
MRNRVERPLTLIPSSITQILKLCRRSRLPIRRIRCSDGASRWSPGFRLCMALITF